jgi:DNA-directed RNA polymerase subunit RPC12/RpoP
MSAAEQRFQSFITRVRPHRVAVLTNSADPYWENACLGIIEFFTKLWGGTHCIIVPTDGESIDETFWAVLSSYDPDTFYRYQRTGADEQIRAPEAFKKIVADAVANEVKNGGYEEEEIRDGIERAILEANFDEWDVSQGLRDEILMRIAPFHFQKQPLHEMDRQLNINSINRASRPSHPFTAVADILRASKRPQNVVQLVRDVDDTIAPPPLWLAATIGSGDSAYFMEMNQIEIVPMPVLMSHYRPSEIIKWGISPRAHLEMPYPLGLTSSILTPVMATRARRFDLPTVVVVGDTVRDFCLYHALYWLHGRAIWLPSWFTSDDDPHSQRLMTAIREAESNGRVEHNERLSFVSYSLDKTVLEDLKQKIVQSMYRTTITIDDIIPATVAWWLEYPSRIYAEGNLGDVTTHLLINDNLPGAFDSPLPRKLSPVNPLAHRWLVDITFMDHLIPRHPTLGQVIITGPNVGGDVRTEREAVTYMCPGALVRGDHMETNMLRPNIHVPGAGEIFRIVLEDCDYRSKTSDKGRYESTTVEKFGGLEKAGYALWSDKHYRLLKKFLGKEKSATDEGVYLESDQRRFMNFAAINKIMESDALSYNLIDEYVDKGVFYRGYIFGCENCSDSAWHSIADVDQTFTCRRCGVKQVYKHRHWKMPNEPLWFYKLDEMVYLMLKYNGHVPLLTLNKLRISSKESFLFCHELRILVEGERQDLPGDGHMLHR